MRKRSNELSSLFRRLYEDSVFGRVTDEQFRMLSADYNAEQKALEDTISKKKARLESLKASAANVDAFIEKAKRYTYIQELTPELLRLFIQRIEVGERSEKILPPRQPRDQDRLPGHRYYRQSHGGGDDRPGVSGRGRLPGGYYPSSGQSHRASHSTDCNGASLFYPGVR